MGMLGAMAGAGRGMQGYAGVMRQTQQNNWQAQQDNVKYERELNLENIRASNKSAEADKQRTYQTERDATQNTLADERLATQNTLADERLATQNKVIDGRKVIGKDAQGIDVTLAELEGKSDEERKGIMSKEQYDVQLAVNKQHELLTLAKTFTEAERMEKAASLRTIWAKDGLSPIEEVRLTAMEKGLDMKDIIGTSKPMSADMVKNLDTLLSQDEAYMNADAGAKISIMRDAYAQLAGSTGASNGAPISYNPEVDIPKLKAMGPDEQKVAMDKIKARDTTLYQQVSRDLAVASQSEVAGPRGPGMLSKAADVGRKILDYGGRNMNGKTVTRAQQLAELKKQQPGMTDLFYESKLN